jgi:hypothetical protein
MKGMNRFAEAAFALLLLGPIGACSAKTPQPVRLERRWLPGVYLCELRDQTDLDTAVRAYGGGQRRPTRITTTEVAELTVGEADASGVKALEWRPRRMAIVQDGAVCDSGSEGATPRCFVPRAIVRMTFKGHVNPDGTGLVDGAAADGWSVYRDWITAEAEQQMAKGDLRAVLGINFGPLQDLPRLLSVGDTWSSSAKFAAPSFGGLEHGFQHKVERMDEAAGGQTVTIVSTSSGDGAGRTVVLGDTTGRLKSVALRFARVFDVALGLVTATSDSAQGELDLDFGPGVTGDLKFRYEAGATCRKAGSGPGAPPARSPGR